MNFNSSDDNNKVNVFDALYLSKQQILDKSFSVTKEIMNFERHSEKTMQKYERLEDFADEFMFEAFELESLIEKGRTDVIEFLKK